MNTEEMLQEVDRRVADGLMEHLLPKAIQNHTVREWKDCTCSYCVTKRKATIDIANINYPHGFTRPIIKTNKSSARYIDPTTFLPSTKEVDADPWEIKQYLRTELRKQYRNKLKELCND